mmetsp:Transcript_16343/g.45293  ORF Transcript_16343/g.45293 Transcript_16343/m.45293 type:complete len:108 (-) Transcript_16343:1054-1377(-)
MLGREATPILQLLYHMAGMLFPHLFVLDARNSCIADYDFHVRLAISFNTHIHVCMYTCSIGLDFIVKPDHWRFEIGCCSMLSHAAAVETTSRRLLTAFEALVLMDIF